MNEAKFKIEMRRARVMEQSSENSHYWNGYQRGLRRSYHGENFGTTEEHEKWLSLVNDTDEWRRQRGLGYRDGLAYPDTLQDKPGRPAVGDVVLPGITVTDDTKERLERKADELGVSVAECRRMAYDAFLT